MLEIISDDARLPSSQRIAFDVLIQILVRIQVRPIAWKIKQSYPPFFLVQPGFHRHRPMRRKTVHNQEDSPRHLPFQPTHKIDEQLGLQPVTQDHKVQSSAVGDGRDYSAAESLAPSWNYGRPSFQPPACPRHMVRPQSHLVAPVDFGLFPLGSPNLRYSSIFPCESPSSKTRQPLSSKRYMTFIGVSPLPLCRVRNGVTGIPSSTRFSFWPTFMSSEATRVRWQHSFPDMLIWQNSKPNWHEAWISSMVSGA